MGITNHAKCLYADLGYLWNGVVEHFHQFRNGLDGTHSPEGCYGSIACFGVEVIQ
ncbi:hypothetical protein BAC2_00527 [uncultured bacterium]|nr:hypothetical protein BAC2_00527 [uncultured bacterium]